MPSAPLSASLHTGVLPEQPESSVQPASLRPQRAMVARRPSTIRRLWREERGDGVREREREREKERERERERERKRERGGMA